MDVTDAGKPGEPAGEAGEKAGEKAAAGKPGEPPVDVSAETPPKAPDARTPGATAPFEPDPRRTVVYRVARATFVAIVGSWFRPAVTGSARVPKDGPVILAPVHRSFADFAFAAFLTRRKLFFMAKDELWRNQALGRLLLTFGAFPVHRDAADREAMRRAERVLQRGQVLVLFPEGTRHEGPVVAELHEGAAFLAARTGAVIVPVGIGGSEAAMPKGTHLPRPIRVHVVAGEPVPPPERNSSGRVPRSTVHATTEKLHSAIQAAFDEALARHDEGAPARRRA